MKELLGLPAAASAHAADVDRAIVLLHAFIIAVFVGWSLFLILALVRYRSARHPTADTRGLRSRAPYGFVALVGVLEAAMFIGLDLPLWRALRSRPPDRRQALEVRVVAEQFNWNVHYAGPDERFGRTAIDLMSPANPLGLDAADPADADDVITLNDVHAPTGRAVIVRLSSKDVIHGFAIPAMRVKRDAVPGRPSALWFTPIREGTFEIACVQLCGPAHYRTRGVLVVEPPAALAAWIARNRPLR